MKPEVDALGHRRTGKCWCGREHRNWHIGRGDSGRWSDWDICHEHGRPKSQCRSEHLDQVRS